jgi:hypothetical protein
LQRILFVEFLQNEHLTLELKIEYMKKIFIFLLAGLVCIAAVFPPAQKKVALIIAIGEYPENGKWRNLSSMNDVKYVKDALIKTGFNGNDIDTLCNKDATKKGMVKALDDLYNRVGEGDIVYFQFSGHGQQIQDDNNDELDGYDEALIPYDAAASFDPVEYKGENHFRDDLLGEKLNAIRKKIGPKGSLVVLIDACHSGTATRDAGIKRGMEQPFLINQKYVPNVKIDLNRNPEQGMLEGFTDGMGTMVVFSACSPNQPNYELKDADKKGVGSLSYAFAKSIADLPAESSYRILFQKMKAFIQGDIATQIPMIEGDIDLEVFGGKYIPKPTIIAVDQKFNNASNKFNDTTFVINLGELNSIYKNTQLKVYVVGSKDVYTEAVVKTVSSFQSICVAKKPLKKSVAYEVQIDASSAGEFSATILLQDSVGNNAMAKSAMSRFESFVKPFQYISINDNPDFTLNFSKAENGEIKVALFEKGDSVRYVKTIKDSLTADDCKFFLDGIKRSMRVKYLRNMVDGGALAKNVTIKIVPKKQITSSNEIVMSPNDAFEIQITNTGTTPFYYSIIDIMPDNDMKVLLPDETSEPQDFVINPNQTIPIGEITVDEGTPNGKEIFKIIVTKTPIDLRGVVNRTRTRSASAGSPTSIENVIDDLFKDSNDQRATRSSIGNIKVDEVGVLSCGFTIKN